LAGGFRPAFIALAAAVVLGASATAAWAGKAPDQRSLLAPTTAGPGDLVLLAIPGTPQGAQYTLTLTGGEVLAKGEDTSPQPGVLGDFKVPDLGPKPRELKLDLAVLDPAGAASKSELSMHYVPTATEQPGSASTVPSPPRLVGPKTAARDAGLVLPSPPKANLPDLPRLADGGSNQVKRRPEKARRTGGASAQRPKAAARPAGAPAGRRPLRKPVRHPRYSSEERSLLNRPIPLLHTPPPAPDHRPHAPRDTRVDLSSGTFPGVGWTVAWRFLAGAAALFLLLSAGVGSVVRQRRRQRIAELDRALEEAPVEEHVSV
jgi:hypothetical protein